MKSTKTIIIVGVAIALVVGAWFYLTSPTEIVDKTIDEISKTKNSIREISRDVIEHNMKTTREVKSIREKFHETVPALHPDDLVLSIDEFIGRWRNPPENRTSPSSSGVDIN